MEINELIRQRRKELGKTQQDIASECNISFQSVGKWERGDSFPGADKMPALSRALQVSVSVLITGEDDGAPPLSSDFDASRFSAFLASLRTRCKLTQSEVAKQLYVNQSTVAKWENAKLLPDAAMLKDLCVLYSVTPTELFSLKADLTLPVTAHPVGDAKSARIWRLLKRWKLATAVVTCLLVAFIVLSTVTLTQNASLLDYKNKYETTVAENKDMVEKYNAVTEQYNEVTEKYESLVKETNTVYTLTLVDDFADEKTATSEVANKDYFALPSPVKEDYVFMGWNTAADGSGDCFEKQIQITSDKTVYAIWQAVWLDERVYGDTAVRINELFRKADADFDKLFGYFAYFRSYFSNPYDEFSLSQQFDTAASIYGCFDTVNTEIDLEYHVRYYPLYICSYLDEAREIAKTAGLEELAAALAEASAAAHKLSCNATTGYYYDDTRQWSDEYKKYVRENYFNDYAPYIQTICDAMRYSDAKENPYDAFVRDYGSEFDISE